MPWFFRGNLWKRGIALLGVLWIVGIPIMAAGAAPGELRQTTGTSVTMQATPTEDATVTALSKEQLAQQVAGQRHTWDNWLWNDGAMIVTSLISTLALAATGVFAVVRYFNDRRDTREKQEAEAKRLAEDHQAERERRDEEQQRWLKDLESERERRAEERFQTVVEGLSGEREEAKVGAAITLRTFLHPGYERFYTQCFDLVVAHLRLPRPASPPDTPQRTLPLTSLSQALMVVFKEAFPLARNQHTGSPQFLDATGIQLDHAYLEGADLRQVWMPDASLHGANLRGADLSGAVLWRTDLSGANLRQANLRGADLWGANMSEAFLRRANLSGAKFRHANFSSADLSATNLRGADLSGATLKSVDLSRSGSRGGSNRLPTDLFDARIEEARTLEGTDLREVIGVTREQLAACKAKGAIIDEEQVVSSLPPPTSSASPTHGKEQRASSPQEHLPAASPDEVAPASSPGDNAKEP